jgi:molecular chaperone HtpG
LGEAVKEVRVSKRLTESPACLVVGDYDMSANLQRVFAQLGQDAPDVKPILEVNPGHALVTRMDQEPDEDLFADLARILFDQSVLAEGGQLEDPAAFVRRLNKLMLS